MNEKIRHICIDPITRLEGHGRIELFLDERGELADAFFQIPELRGFERFCQGRRGEDMPQITERICGVCPEAHHLASTKALDACYAASPPPRARVLRELLYNAYIFSDHLLHFYYLGGPDFLVGFDAPPQERNILGVVGKVGIKLGKEVIKHRSYGQEIIETIGGRSIHPVTGIPGGQSKGISKEEREKIESMGRSLVEFARTSLSLFRDTFLSDPTYRRFTREAAQELPTYYMGLVGEGKTVNFYDGDVRVITPDGKEFASVEGPQVLSLIAERTEPWTYVKIPYLKTVGWQGFQAGKESGIYRVGPLARLNVCKAIGTPLAQAEYETYLEYFNGGPVHATFAYHWARLIEMLSAAERVVSLTQDPALMAGPLRAELGPPGEGVGVIEAARGTLIHHYNLDEKGLVRSANLIVATTHNVAGISLSIKEMARAVVHNSNVDQGILNLIEMSFRSYDPCLACATHALPGQLPLVVVVRDAEGKELKRISRWND
jgi:F420-non-reducing hydrogenase large subunit